jgi:hypothetical protein
VHRVTAMRREVGRAVGLCHAVRYFALFPLFLHELDCVLLPILWLLSSTNTFSSFSFFDLSPFLLSTSLSSSPFPSLLPLLLSCLILFPLSHLLLAILFLFSFSLLFSSLSTGSFSPYFNAQRKNVPTHDFKEGKERERERERDKDGGGKSTLAPDELMSAGRGVSRPGNGNTPSFAALEDTVRVRSNSDSTISEPDRQNEVRNKRSSYLFMSCYLSPKRREIE